MKAKELNAMSKEELQSKLTDENAAYNKLRMTHKTAAIENPIQLRVLRRNIARLNTIISHKQ